jgi:hypothetical protein
MICVHFNQKTDIEGIIYCGYCGEVRKAKIIQKHKRKSIWIIMRHWLKCWVQLS